MLLTHSYGRLKLSASVSPGGRAVVFVLVPGGLVPEMEKWAEEAAPATGGSLVLVSGMDWNNDMTPWAAEGVMKKAKPFGGDASGFLNELLEIYMPEAERWLGGGFSERYLMGISLSGLFAVWTLARTNAFSGVASVSGSLWYDGFSGWLKQQPLPAGTRVYLSLGKKEKDVPDKRMSVVEERTGEVAGILESKGLEVSFEMVGGTHFSPAAPKFSKALEALLGNN